MKSAMIVVAILAAWPAAAWADPETDAFKAVIKAVKHGDDLEAAFPGAVTASDAAALKRVRWCETVPFVKEGKGHYAMVWDCRPKTPLGMEVVVIDARVTSITTMPVVRRPD